MADPKDQRTKALENLLMHYLKLDKGSGAQELRLWLSAHNSCTLTFNRAPTRGEMEALTTLLQVSMGHCPDERRPAAVEAVNAALAAQGHEPIEEHPELRNR